MLTCDGRWLVLTSDLRSHLAAKPPRLLRLDSQLFSLAAFLVCPSRRFSKALKEAALKEAAHAMVVVAEIITLSTLTALAKAVHAKYENVVVLKNECRRV